MVQKTLAARSVHAIAGTLPVIAAKAIGIPKPNATPSHACGIVRKRLVKG